MPKHTTVEVLKRWRELDREMSSSPGINIREFARRWKVSEEAIKRDLEAFRKLGRPAMCRRDESDGRYYWVFTGGDWLFAVNLRRALRGLLGMSSHDVDWQRVGVLVKLLNETGMKVSEAIDVLKLRGRR